MMKIPVLEVNRALFCGEYERVYKTEYLPTLMKLD